MKQALKLKESNKEILKQKIYESNKLDHDDWASTHDSNVPYISRKKTRMFYWKLLLDNIKKNNIDLRNKKILEVGCGTGTYTDLFINQNISQYVGIDLSPRMIEFAKKKNRLNSSHFNKINFLVSSLEDFSIKNPNRYDVIYSTSFLHHLLDVKLGLKKIENMLKADGIDIALLEPINFRNEEWIEQLDFHLMNLAGFGGSKRIHLLKRYLYFIKFIIIESFYKRIFKNQKNNRELKIPKKINYVDYQLNKSFRLSDFVTNNIMSYTYKYLGYIEFSKFMKNDNHQMLILKK